MKMTKIVVYGPEVLYQVVMMAAVGVVEVVIVVVGVQAVIAAL